MARSCDPPQGKNSTVRWGVVLFTSLVVVMAPLSPAGANPSVIAYDGFDRIVSGVWGLAASGQEWILNGTPDDWAAYREGLVSIPSAGTGRSASLQGVSVESVSLKVAVRTSAPPTDDGQVVNLRTRVLGNSAAYEAQFRLNRDSTVDASLWRRAADGSLTQIVGRTAVPGLDLSGSAINARFEATGVNPTTLRARAWDANGSEPATWLVSQSDSFAALQTSGSIAIGGYLPPASTTVPLVFAFDALTVSQIDPSLPPPDEDFGVTIPTSFGTEIGTASFPVPDDARYVSPSGSNTNDGSAAAPWRTVSHAVETVAPGTTIVLRAGAYREQIEINESPVTIQNFPGEVAWLSGSDVVTGWVTDGGSWRKDGWTAHFPRDEYDDSHFNPEFPHAGWPDMVFVNGAPLRQVGSRATVTAGTFYVNYATDQLFIGTNPSGQTVEASTRSQALRVTASGTALRGVGVKHYANTVFDLGALLINAADVTLEEVVVQDNAAVGVAVYGARFQVLRSTISRNGLAGLHGSDLAGFVAEGNKVSGNNAEHFAYGSSQAGMKVTGSNGVQWRGNLAENNDANGLWCDVGCSDVVAVRNVLRHNAQAGIIFEMSDRGVLASNLSHGNGNGIYLLEATNVEIWNNTLHGNRRNIYVLDGYRVEYIDNVTIRNNVLSGAQPDTISSLGVIDINKGRTGGQMGVSANCNAYFRSSAVDPTWLTVWANEATNLIGATLAEFTQTTGQESFGLYGEGPANPFIADLDGGDAGRPLGSSAIDSGDALPAAIAAAIGVPADGPVDIGVLRLG